MTRRGPHAQLVALLLAVLLAAPAAAQGDPAETTRERVRIDWRAGSPGGLPTAVEVHAPKHAAGALPTVMVVAGWGLTSYEYQSIARELAGRGFVAVIYEHPLGPMELDPKAYARGVGKTLDALTAMKKATPALKHADLRTVGVVGHSIGGATAMIAAADDKRIKAGVSISPGSHLALNHRASEAARRVKAPMLVIGGANDAVSPTRVFAEPLYEQLGSKNRMLIELKGANHFNFADVPLWMKMFIPTEYLPGYAPTISAADQRDVTHRYTIAWLQRFLSKAGDPRGLTDGTAARRDVEKGALSKVETTVKPAGDGLAPPTVSRNLRSRIAARDAAIEANAEQAGNAGRGSSRRGAADRLGEVLEANGRRTGRAR